MDHLVNGCLLLVLVIAVFKDLANHKIPNKLIFLGILMGVFVQVFGHGAWGIVFFLKGAFIGLCLFLPLYLLGGMAAGDVKLLMVIGGLVNTPLVYSVALYSLVCGAVIAIMIVFFTKKWLVFFFNMFQLFTALFAKTLNSKNRITIEESTYAMPYAPAIALGTVCAIYKPLFL